MSTGAVGARGFIPPPQELELQAVGAGNQTPVLLEYADLPLTKLREETCLIFQRVRRYRLKWMRSSNQS